MKYKKLFQNLQKSMGKFRPKRFRYIGGGDQGVNIIFCLLLFSTSFFFRQISFSCYPISEDSDKKPKSETFVGKTRN